MKNNGRQLDLFNDTPRKLDVKEFRAAWEAKLREHREEMMRAYEASWRIMTERLGNERR